MTLLLLLTGCHRETLMSREAQAAYLYYQTYADREGLTVAFVGDYIVDTMSLTAVMLQAQDSMAWVWLMDNLVLSRQAKMTEDLLQYKNMEMRGAIISASRQTMPCSISSIFVRRTHQAKLSMTM